MTMDRRIILCAVGGVSLLLLSCTPRQYARQADRDAYRTVRTRQPTALGTTRPFDIAYDPSGYGPGGTLRAVKVDGRVIELNAPKPSLLKAAEALEIAFRNSRDLQTRKETVYAAALALANARRSWDFPLLGGEVAALAEHVKENKGPETPQATADPQATLTQQFYHGGVLTLGYALSLATDFSGLDNVLASSLLTADFRQPLLRGAWRGFAYEPVYRQERDFVFSLYDYERSRDLLASSVYTQYYNVLETRDQLQNERANIERLKQTLALTRVLVEGGQRSRIEQDQAEQNMLGAEVRLERQERLYFDSLDDFKLLIGLPVASNIELDYPEALAELGRTGTRPLGLTGARAVELAMWTQPDLLVRRSAVRDAARDVEIAADAFLPQLDVELQVAVPGQGQRDFQRSRFNRHTRTGRLTLDYPLNQTDNRDAYRVAMIVQAQAERDLVEEEESVRLTVLRRYRLLEQSQRTYEIQKRNVELAQRRRLLASLQQKEGQASARDVLEAEADLLNAQNGLTQALVSYVTTRLQFLAEMGMLYVSPQGRIEERKAPMIFDRIQRRYPYVGPAGR
ncbi:MAG: Outer membrane efflux protein [Planctomycetes bacterium ADurb.Bin126]|nr:MAG: Outer membrane efflux protein [Planctomycetes bacterium ADurb.Bin126]